MALWIAMDDGGSDEIAFFSNKPNRIVYDIRESVHDTYKKGMYWDDGLKGGTVLPKRLASVFGIKPGDCMRVRLELEEEGYYLSEGV